MESHEPGATYIAEQELSSTGRSDDGNNEDKAPAITTSPQKSKIVPREGKQSEDDVVSGIKFKPMISASGRDYNERKGVARVIKKIAQDVDQTRDEKEEKEEDVHGAVKPPEELQEGDMRRSKRLAEKRKWGY